MADARHRNLVMVALVLAAARFLVVPWVQAQGAERERLEALTRRLDRSQAVLHSGEDIRTVQQQLATEVDAILGRFPSAPDVDGFRLQAQRKINALAAASGIQVTLFDWVVDGEAPEAGLGYGRARFRVEGPLRDLIRMHGQLEGTMPNAAVREFRLQAQDPVNGPSDLGASVIFAVDLYFRPAEPQQSGQEPSA